MQNKGTFKIKSGLAQMLKGGVIMDVVNAEQAKIAEDAGAVAVMALERGYYLGACFHPELTTYLFHEYFLRALIKDETRYLTIG